MNVKRLAVRALCVVAGCGGVAYGAPPNPCSLLTAQQVTAVLGVAVGQGQPMGSTLCQWTQQGVPALSAKKVYVVLLTAQGFQARITPVNDPAITKTAVSGVGDQANYGVAQYQPGSLAVKKGDVYFSVQIRGLPKGQERAKETTLAQEIVARL